MYSVFSRHTVISIISAFIMSACGGGSDDPTPDPAPNPVPVTAAPAAPDVLNVQLIAPGYVNLTWADNSSNESGFTIERKTGAAGSYTELVNVTSNAMFYKDSTVSVDETYFYRIYAYNTDGDSSFSNEVSATTSGSVPGDPVNLVASATSPAQIELSWTDTADNELTYFVERKVGPNDSFSLHATLDPDANTFTDSALDEQRAYAYRVRASNTWGTTAYTNEDSVITPSVASAGLWARTYQGEGDAYAYSVINTSDGGFLIAGKVFISSSGTGNYDVWLIKLAADETIEWQKSFGGTSADVANSVIQTADGGFLMAGSSASFNSGSASNDIWLVKLNNQGVILWQQRYGAGPAEEARAIVQTDDNADGIRDDGYILVGNNSATGAAQVIKLDADGVIEWQQYHETGFGNVHGYSVQQTADNSFVVTGDVYNSTSTNRDLWVMKLSSAGVVSWEKTYAGADNSSGYKIIQSDDDSDGLADDGYLVLGVTDTDATSSIVDAVWVLKLLEDGSIDWQKTYLGSGSESARDVIQTASGKFLLAATSSSFGASSNDFWIMQLNSDGTIDWQKRYGALGGETPYAIQQTPDLGLITVGSTRSFATGVSEIWALRLSSAADITFLSNINASTEVTTATVQDTTTTAVVRTRNASTTTFSAVTTTAVVTDSDALVNTQSQH